MSFLVAQPWLAVAVPFAIALVLGVGGSRLRAAGPWLAILGPLLTVVLGIASIGAVESAGEASGAAAWNTSAVVSSGGYDWFKAGDVALRVAWSIDSLTAIMLLVVGVVATCVVLFSVGYMHGEKGWVRYFALLALFTGSMNLLTIGSTLTTLFVGWELVGACSFLLIGFWYEKPSAAAAAIKAFVTTRVGDVGLLIGIALLWTGTGAETYDGVTGNLGSVGSTALTAAAICLAIGAMGKSAQFPLHAWLPDAMEGPTPVSALIHAATMVAAGVFLAARLWPIFDAAPQAQLLLLAVGAISAFGAALAALAQRDIKKLLAYSTISQLGFMFAALGAGAWFAAFFHLVTHAAFKALLFLTSGSVIHGTGTQDMREMGGLRKTMPFTSAAWVVGVIALAGIPPLAGFWSKDLVLESVFHASPGVGILLFGASAVTAFYCARSTRLVFFGEPAPGLHPHESGAMMLVPLGVLGAAAVTLGFAGAPMAELLGQEHEPLVVAVSAAAVGLAAVGAGIGWWVTAGRQGDVRTESSLGGTWRTLAAAYHWDALVDRVFVRPTIALSRSLWAVGDRLLADGAAEGSARLARALGNGFSRLQSGDAQSYTAVIVIGFLLMFTARYLVGFLAWIGGMLG